MSESKYHHMEADPLHPRAWSAVCTEFRGVGDFGSSLGGRRMQKVKGSGVGV